MPSQKGITGHQYKVVQAFPKMLIIWWCFRWVWETTNNLGCIIMFRKLKNWQKLYLTWRSLGRWLLIWIVWFFLVSFVLVFLVWYSLNPAKPSIIKNMYQQSSTNTKQSLWNKFNIEGLQKVNTKQYLTIIGNDISRTCPQYFENKLSGRSPVRIATYDQWVLGESF